MDEVLRRHASEFDAVYHLIDTVDLVKNGETYRVEIQQQMNTKYRKQFQACHFKKEKTVSQDQKEFVSWVALDSVSPAADTARDALNQALIWLSVQTKKGVI